MSAGPLHLVDDDLAQCVACGLCLPHCPTYRVTGDETASPRGRIAAMRQVQWHDAPLDASFHRMMDECVQCLGCETACPSGVPYGRLIEGAREALAATGSGPPRWQQLAFRALGHHRMLLLGNAALGAAQRLRVLPTRISRRLGLPAQVPVRQRRLRASGDDAWLFTGCVMDAWQRDVHAAAKRVVEATGAGVALLGPGGDCCGALHEHAGLGAEARRLAERVIGAAPGDAPIVVDSAGCGAMLSGYGRLLGTPEARQFSQRVVDVHEWLASRLELLPAVQTRIAVPVAVHDPCHLRHAQRVHGYVREVLRPYADLVELDDEGLCCGAGGAFAVVHPELAGPIRERKLASIARSGATVVVSANPGCALHLSPALAAEGVRVLHPIEVLAQLLER